MAKNIEIKGLAEVERNLKRVEDQAKQRVVEEIEREFPLNELRAVVPVRTGKLRRSLRMQRDGNVFQFTGQWYGQVVRLLSGRYVRDELEHLFRKAIEKIGHIRI